MCGISGIINFHKNFCKLDYIKQMNLALHHRGSDSEGIFISKDHKSCFGHTLLSIVGSLNTQQPFIYNFNNQEAAITFNGEIYNYKEIKNELIKLKWKFYSDTDTEVLLVAFLQWQEKCLDKLNGEFAFAIYYQNKIFFARDRMGIKPFFYHITQDNTFVFASEVKAILKLPFINTAVNPDALGDYILNSMLFTNGSINLSESFFKDILSLEPGYYGYLTTNSLQLFKYWDYDLQENILNEEDATTLLKNSLIKSIKLRIPDKINYSTLLSGGLDSSIITSFISSRRPEKILSCCINYEDNTNEDLKYAKILTESHRINLVSPIIKTKHLINCIDDLITALDEPHDTTRQLGLLLSYKELASHKSRVVILGEGADEFNYGYYFNSPGFHKDLKILENPILFRRILINRLHYTKKLFNKSFAKKINWKNIISQNLAIYNSKDLKPRSKVKYYYMKKFLKYRLNVNDRCSMFYSLEARVPFCDHNVVETCNQIPIELHIKDNVEKNILRKAFKYLLPNKISQRPKFALPENVNLNFQKDLLILCEEEINRSPTEIWNILDFNNVTNLVMKFRLKITEIETSATNNDLNHEISLSEKIFIRTKHIFIILCIIRWYSIYFKYSSENLLQRGDL